MEVALQFDVDIFGAEDADESIELAPGFVSAALLRGPRRAGLRRRR